MRRSESVTTGIPSMDRLRRLIDADPRPLHEIARACRRPEAHLYQFRSGRRAELKPTTIQQILDGLGRRWADLDPE